MVVNACVKENTKQTQETQYWNVILVIEDIITDVSYIRGQSSTFSRSSVLYAVFRKGLSTLNERCGSGMMVSSGVGSFV